MEPRKTSDFIDRLVHVDGIDFPELVLRPDNLECELGKVRLELSSAEFVMLWLFAIRCKNSNPPLKGNHALLEEFVAFSESVSMEIMPGIGHSARFAGFTEKEVADTADTLSEKIRAAVSTEKCIDYIIPVKPNSTFSILIPTEKIFCPRNY
ncbi:MAG: hypothetical protein WAX69_19635 [Victivallales bacterium]